MKLYIDDQFIPVGSYLLLAQRMGADKEIYLTDWKIVRSYEEMVEFIMFNHTLITHISFDYDLDQYDQYKGKNGLDCAKWVKDYYETNNLPLPKIYIHSRNAFGIEDIWKVFPFPSTKY